MDAAKEYGIGFRIISLQVWRHMILKKAFEGKLLSTAGFTACLQQADWEPTRDLLKRIREDNKT